MSLKQKATEAKRRQILAELIARLEFIEIAVCRDDK